MAIVFAGRVFSVEVETPVAERRAHRLETSGTASGSCAMQRDGHVISVRHTAQLHVFVELPAGSTNAGEDAE